MAKSGKFKGKTILLLDEKTKKLMIVLGVSANRKATGNIHFKKMDSALFANADFKI
jgi:hypothetical protein